VDLELVTPNMVWKPKLNGSEKGSVQALVERWLTSFLEVWIALLSQGLCVCCPLPELVSDGLH
jgi:hypothetical protein